MERAGFLCTCVASGKKKTSRHRLNKWDTVALQELILQHGSLRPTANNVLASQSIIHPSHLFDVGPNHVSPPKKKKSFLKRWQRKKKSLSTGKHCWNRVCHWNRKQQRSPPAAEPQSAWADWCQRGCRVPLWLKMALTHTFKKMEKKTLKKRQEK